MEKYFLIYFHLLHIFTSSSLQDSTRGMVYVWKTVMKGGKKATNLGGLRAVWLLIFNLVSRRERSLGAGEEQAISAKSLQTSINDKRRMHIISA